jgi:hypothetical protein
MFVSRRNIGEWSVLKMHKMTTKCRIKPFLDHLHDEILVTVIQPFTLTKFPTHDS